MTAARPKAGVRLLRYEKVASRPTAASVQAYFDEWVALYQDYYFFPPNLPERFTHGFDSYKVTYCTVDAVLPGERTARPTSATGMLSVPRGRGPFPTAAYQHGTSISYYDAMSNPNIVGPIEPRGESFEGPPADAVFAGGGLILVGADLRENAVDNWRPKAPQIVFQSTVDEEAPYADALESVARLRRAGADVTVETLTGFDHINTWVQIMPRAVTWFRSFAECAGSPRPR